MVTSLIGTGTASLPGSGSVPLREQQALLAGSQICTDKDSYATLRLGADQTRQHDEVTLLGGTCLTITAVRSTPSGRSSVVELDAGALSVRDSASAGQVMIRTRDGVASAENGGFWITLEQGTTRTEALTHPIFLMGAGKLLRLPVNYGSRVRNGQAPEDPTALLSPGTPVTPEPGAALKRPDFTWSAVERALGYRVELAMDAEFSRLLRVEDVDATFWFPEVLFLPFRIPGLWWRVSSFDRTGFLGVPSSPRALVFPAGIADDLIPTP